MSMYILKYCRTGCRNLPLQAQAELAVNIQTYLERSGYGDVTELYINNYTEDGQNITIQCNMDGYADELLIEYDGGREAPVLLYCEELKQTERIECYDDLFYREYI